MFLPIEGPAADGSGLLCHIGKPVYISVEPYAIADENIDVVIDADIALQSFGIEAGPAVGSTSDFPSWQVWYPFSPTFG